MKKIEINKADVAASFQAAVVEVLTMHTLQVAQDFGIKKVAIAGGVASNSSFRESMEQACKANDFEFYYPSPIYCTDNAAMIGVAAYYEFINGTRHGLNLNAVPNLKIGQR